MIARKGKPKDSYITYAKLAICVISHKNSIEIL